MTQEEWNNWQKKQLEDPRWKEFRRRILRRDHYVCRICGKGLKEVGSLHVHHLYYLTEDGQQKDYWSYPSNAVVTLCPECHAKEHDIISSGVSDEIQSLKKCGVMFAEIKTVLANYKETVCKVKDINSSDVSVIGICNVRWKTKISKRAVNILEKNAIFTLGDLMVFKDSGYLLEDMVGRKAYNAIIRLMNEYGLYIKFGI